MVCSGCQKEQKCVNRNLPGLDFKVCEGCRWRWRPTNEQGFRDRTVKQKKEYHLLHRMERAEYDKNQYLKNRDKHIKKSIKWFKENPERAAATNKLWKLKNAEKLMRLGILWRKRNRNKISFKENERRHTDLEFKLRKSLRGRIYSAIRNNQRAGSAVKDIGCTVPELKKYLESKFQSGMTWDNWSFRGWHIDHIKPLSSFDLTNREQFLQACHYTNLQPLWWFENFAKSDKWT